MQEVRTSDSFRTLHLSSIMALKNLISSPLEAGQSVLDAHRLPSHLDAALEYTARRLARKSLSIDLVVIRREYQLTQAAVPPQEELSQSQSQSQAQAAVPDTPPPASTDTFTMKPLPPLPPMAPPPVASTSRFASALKGLVRSNTVPSLTSPTSATAASATVSPTSKRADGKSKWPFSPSRSLSSASASASSSPSFPSLSSFSSASSSFFFSSVPNAYPSTPSTPATPATPATPSTDASADSFSTTASSLHSHMSASTNTHGHHASVSRSSSGSSLSPSSFGIRLVHADDLPHTHKRVLAHILGKAAQRFHLPPNWLPLPVHASEIGLPASLVSRSVQQNQVLFQGGSDEHAFAAVRPTGGLVLRSLDHLYTFKAALCSYAQTGDHYRLEDAVDELRRYILLFLGGTANPGKRSLSKRELLRQYPELSCFTDTHIADVNRMYSRAYGGPDHECGIEADGLSLSPPPSLNESLAETSSIEEEQSTPIATAVDDSALISINALNALKSIKSANRSVTMDTNIAWTRPSLQSSTSPVPVLGMARRTRRPTGMIFARPSSSEEPTVVDSAPPTASSLSSSVLSTPSSLPSLSLSMSSFVSQLEEEEEETEEMGMQEKQEKKETQETHQVPILQAEDIVSPMTPADMDTEVKLAQEMPLSKVMVAPPAPATTTIVFRPMARSFMPTLPSPTSPLSPTLPRSPTSPTARVPLLKLQTTFEKPKVASEQRDAKKLLSDKPGKEDEEEEQLTARPVSCVRRTFFFGGGGLGSSIGEVLGDLASAGGKKRRSADTILTLASPLTGYGDDPVSAGPVPPRSYDDISPITRSEWGFLKGDLMGRQVTVTTF
ncbi:hypothetical protein F503_08008 [Ophiostoma piceae UAMH 11346]|uniref:DUF7582 domain-containing protein n=1 Tax=Ophiostoma piceae (strain UAMH 11346) TaxID=1262450 RepID=S3C3J9_OPHP1|nr:hypothetical protein F503_08008 [Ophiostoma piceae UAMH 11346]